jgi:hypothetical protein
MPGVATKGKETQAEKATATKGNKTKQLLNSWHSCVKISFLLPLT